MVTMNNYPTWFTNEDKNELDIIRKTISNITNAHFFVIEKDSRYVNIEVDDITPDMWDILDTISVSLPVGYCLTKDAYKGERYEIFI